MRRFLCGAWDALLNLAWGDSITAAVDGQLSIVSPDQPFANFNVVSSALSTFNRFCLNWVSA